MLTRLLVITSFIALIPVLGTAQLSKTKQDNSVVLLTSPGKCSGTGFFISGNVIMTANHVVKTTVVEALIKGKTYQCKIVKQDDQLDWATLKVSGYTCKSPIIMAAPQVGARLYSYGFPGHSGKMHVSDGDCYIGYLFGYWEFTGEAKPGMSGGPVVNSKGQAVGITTNLGPFGHTIFRNTQETGLY